MGTDTTQKELRRPEVLECDVVRFQNAKDKWVAFIGLLDGFRITGGSSPALTELQALTGVMLDSDPLYEEYLAQHEQKLRRAAEGLRRSGREDALCRAEEAERLVRQIEEKRSGL